MKVIYNGTPDSRAFKDVFSVMLPKMLDEDEMVRVMEHGAADCPYYRYYDEYMMVRRQN